MIDMNKRYFGFTLAEMMIVMLILTIMLAFAAPLMTKKKNINSGDKPWEWADNNTDAHFGAGNKQSALIGLTYKNNTDGNPKLIIQTNDTNPAILFKNKSGENISKIAELVAYYTTNAGNTYGTLKLGGPYEAGATGYPTTAFGIGALSKSSGGNNSAFGFNALKLNTTGVRNTAIGDNALASNISGNDNIAIGVSALSASENKSNNIAVGKNALYTNSAENNLAIGNDALNTNSGGNNIAIGNEALKTNTSVNNIAIGNSTMKQNTGTQNTAVGHKALENNTSGYYNVAVGYNALSSNTNGNNNVAIGMNSCRYVTAGNYKTCIGTDSGPESGSTHTTSSDNIIYLGTSSTTVYIPGKLIVGGHTLLANNGGEVYIPGNLYVENNVGLSMNTRSTGALTWVGTKYNQSNNRKVAPIYLSSSGNNDPVIGGNNMNDEAPSSSNFAHLSGTPLFPDGLSDKRLKNISGKNKSGLEQIRELRVFNYTFKKDEKKTPHVGVIAQDLQKIFPDAVTKDEDGYLKIRMEDMFYAVINSVKELDNFVQGIINEIKIVYEKITGIDNRVKVLEQENKQLKEQLNAINKRLEKLEKK